MSTYVMSDIHGEFSTFLSMLEQLRFSPEDSLYIIGDVIDRGPDGVQLLQYTMTAPNVHLLLGNHEYMCTQYFSPDADETIRRRWNRNGNYPTLCGFDKLPEEEFKAVLAYMEQLPPSVMLDVAGRRFMLVHGFPADNTHDQVWKRPMRKTMPDVPPDVTVIVGHTPVAEYICPGSDEELYVHSRHLTESGDHFRIFYAPGFIDIDCCVAFRLSAARLACLRLEDMREFYQVIARD